MNTEAAGAHKREERLPPATLFEAATNEAASSQLFDGARGGGTIGGINETRKGEIDMGGTFD